MANGELYHHGILGQKWGVRRYQNPDGTYTNAGRKRYGIDLDLNDKSRKNVAAIRLGEARRRLDVAKAKDNNNYTRVAELQGRVRSAKQATKLAKKVDKGAKLESKGQTISGNNFRIGAANLAAGMGSKALTRYLNTRMSDLSSQGRWTPAHTYVASEVNKYGQLALSAVAAGYTVKKYNDNKAIRAYNASKWGGESTLKRIGSTEYADRVGKKVSGRVKD